MEEDRRLPEVRRGGGGYGATSWGPLEGVVSPWRGVVLPQVDEWFPGLFLPTDTMPWVALSAASSLVGLPGLCLRQSLAPSSHLSREQR